MTALLPRRSRRRSYLTAAALHRVTGALSRAERCPGCGGARTLALSGVYRDDALPGPRRTERRRRQCVVCAAVVEDVRVCG